MISKSGSLKRRIIASLIMAPLALAFIITGGVGFNVLVGLIAGRAIYEWNRMVAPMKNYTIWLTLGIAYIALGSVALADIRDIQPSGTGLHMTLWLFLIIWACDVGAYFSGKLIGGPKLAPKISPNKTWAGLCGAIVLSSVTSGAYIWFIEGPGILTHAMLGGAFAIVAQAGDFFVSWVKRRSGVKDAGNIIPGHGGILDRIDGMLAVVPLSWLMLYYSMPGML